MRRLLLQTQKPTRPTASHNRTDALCHAGLRVRCTFTRIAALPFAPAQRPVLGVVGFNDAWPQAVTTRAR